ncbi:MAG: hypothetical protein QM765_22450 [Myxococcales bacterium]
MRPSHSHSSSSGTFWRVPPNSTSRPRTRSKVIPGLPIGAGPPATCAKLSAPAVSSCRPSPAAAIVAGEAVSTPSLEESVPSK